MKKELFNFLLLILLGFSCSSIAQNQTNKWYFGINAGLDFNFSPPIPIVGSNMIAFEGCASIADAAGNLLFYSDGLTVWDQTNSIMAGGTGLLGGSSSAQSCIIIKQPGNSNIYFIFTSDNIGLSNNGVNYSTVDMNLAAGLGSVTVLNTPLYAPSRECLTSVRHCNGVDIWVLSIEALTGNIRAYLVTNSGVNTSPIISLGVVSAITSATSGAEGCMKVSPNGKKVGLALYGGGCEIYDFDSSTGLASNPLNLPVIGSLCYGCEFSPDGTKFYGVTFNFGELYQWDLCASSNSAIIASQFTISTTIGSGTSLQLAPDGKIYLSDAATSSSLDVINNPNVAGVGCNYVPAAQSIGSGITGYGLPNFMSSYFLPAPSLTFTTFTYTNSPTVCYTSSFTASPNPTISCAASGYSFTNISWIFGDVASGSANTSTLVNPTHTYPMSGSYTVKQIFHYACGSDTLTQQVLINGTLSNTITAAAGAMCNGTASASIMVSGGSGSYTYLWDNGSILPFATNLLVGIHTVTVVDAVDPCPITQTFQITSPPTLTLNIIASSPTACAGANITFTANASGGTAGYTYTWTGGSNTQTQVVSQVLGGLYTYTVNSTDVNNCLVSNTVLINFQAIPALAVVPSPSVCPLQTASLSAFGATNYTWLPAGSIGNTFIVNPISTSVYTVIGSINGCVGPIVTTTINVKPVPVPTLSSNSPACGTQTLNLFVEATLTSGTDQMPIIRTCKTQLLEMCL
jgi:PKD repeat protein